MITVKNLSYSVLKNIAFQVPRGILVAIVGPNGSGKTTLVKIIGGLIKNYQGEVKVNTKSKFYLSQHLPKELPALNSEVILTGLEKSSFYEINEKEWERAREYLSLLDLKEKPYDEQSGGEKQKTLLARALISDAELLLLDEPFSALDVKSSKLVYKLLKDYVKRGNTALVVTHDLSMVSKYVDRVICLGGKEFLTCHVDEFNLDTIVKLYGEDFKVIHHVH